jgi:integrase
MASIFKSKGATKYTIFYTDETGKRRKKMGATDKGVSQRIANDLENKVVLRKQGLIDPKDEAYRDHEASPLANHLAAYKKSLEAKGGTLKHVELITDRAARIVALIKGARLADIERASTSNRSDRVRIEANLAKWVASARLSDLTSERVQKALVTLKTEGRSLATCNHYRAAIKGFSKWCFDTHRIREDNLRGVTGFNAKEDRRHDRRTVSLEELRRLVEVAERGPVVIRVSGPVRALCYRLAVATGLRYSEISSIIPESFDWKAPSVTVGAAYTKNGQTATFPLQDDLVGDLADYVTSIAPGSQVFPLPSERGALMLRTDLEAAGIPYRDASGLVFDFHALRCQMATNADAAGVSPRVVQKMMRHSNLELTGHYTRPRVVDVERASSLLPSLKSDLGEPEPMTMTGTDGNTVSFRTATQNATETTTDESKSNENNIVTTQSRRYCGPPSRLEGNPHDDPSSVPSSPPHAGRVCRGPADPLA